MTWSAGKCGRLDRLGGLVLSDRRLIHDSFSSLRGVNILFAELAASRDAVTSHPNFNLTTVPNVFLSRRTLHRQDQCTEPYSCAGRSVLNSYTGFAITELNNLVIFYLKRSIASRWGRSSFGVLMCCSVSLRECGF
ncbi:hypothetical protein Y032_0541g3208 [Ancylostoma ceylanicum]|nr:hypothetical protein Y032_0541g3208 [Ancylostoma ceylanicum]